MCVWARCTFGRFSPLGRTDVGSWQMSSFCSELRPGEMETHTHTQGRRDGALMRDDELSLVSSPAASPSVALTISLVRHTFSDLISQTEYLNQSSTHFCDNNKKKRTAAEKNGFFYTLLANLPSTSSTLFLRNRHPHQRPPTPSFFSVLMAKTVKFVTPPVQMHRRPVFSTCGELTSPFCSGQVLGGGVGEEAVVSSELLPFCGPTLPQPSSSGRWLSPTGTALSKKKVLVYATS